MNKEDAKIIAMGLRTYFKCESDTMVEFCNIVVKALEQTDGELGEVDFIELRHRYGETVEKTVRRMCGKKSEEEE